MPSRGTVVAGKFDHVWRALLSVKSYSTVSLASASKVARNAFVAVTTSAVLAPPGLTPSVLRFTGVTSCMPPPGPPPLAPPLGGPPEGWALPADEAAGDADEVELLVFEPQPATVSTVAASTPAARD